MFGWLRRKPDLERMIAAAIEHHEAGRLDAAQAAYAEVLRHDPGHVDALHFLGFLSFQRADYARAEALIARALALNPRNARAQHNLGNARHALGRHAEAAASFEAALALDPELLEARFNLGIALRELGRREDAARAFAEVLRRKPDAAEAHYCLGHLHADEDRVPQARASFRQALALRPQLAEARMAEAVCALPQVYGPGEDPASARTEFAAALAGLERWGEEARGAAAAAAVGAMQPFALAYQEEPNRDLLARYGALCSRLMAQAHPVPARAARRRGGPIRVGVVSAQFHDHSVWHALVKGWFAELDRSRFALHAFHLGSRDDAETGFARAAAASFEQGARDVSRWADAIGRLQPDVLIYPEIGMDPMSLRLGALRLAPVQVATWGHPETTGLPTIDYYLSAAGLEPPDAQANYTEKLVLLPGLGCHFEPRASPAGEREPALPALAPGESLLVCPGVPFKYAPQHDWMFPEVARQLGRCRFVFFVHSTPALTARFRERLRAAFAARGLELERFAAFLPWLPKAEFRRLLERADLSLDTIGFSGFNTALQALECGLPMVAREGRFLRGRLASGILRRLGLDELVASSEEDYAARVVALARDAGARARLRAALAARRGGLYRDLAPVRALEDFLAAHAQGA